MNDATSVNLVDNAGHHRIRILPSDDDSVAVHCLVRVRGGVVAHKDSYLALPPVATIITNAGVNGEYCRRPFSVGQRGDSAARVPLLALFTDWARARMLDPWVLFAEAYPDESPVDWTEIKEEARGQGIVLPRWNLVVTELLVQSLRESRMEEPGAVASGTNKPPIEKTG